MDLVSQLRGIRPGEDSVRADGGEVERHGERHGSSIFTYHVPRLPDAVGYPKNRDEVVEEVLGGSLPCMRAVKRFADLNGVLNPGNLYPG